MLFACRKSDGHTVEASLEFKRNGPFLCLNCHEAVILKTGANKVNHFAHINPLLCSYNRGESQEHRRCKTEISQALRHQLGVENVTLELPMGLVRPDVFAVIKGVPVAIEVQISSLSIERIMERTIAYHQKGIYVLWLLPWNSKLEANRYAPKPWEKWLHAAYFGRVYYWVKGLEILPYCFEPVLKSIPAQTWYSKRGTVLKSKGFTRRLKKVRTPIPGKVLHLVNDFAPRLRYWWEGEGVKVPDARLFMEKDDV
ncbi:MAG: competence protein CoiA [Verrucomicrobiales bacterium]